MTKNEVLLNAIFFTSEHFALLSSFAESIEKAKVPVEDGKDAEVKCFNGSLISWHKLDPFYMLRMVNPILTYVENKQLVNTAETFTKHTVLDISIKDDFIIWEMCKRVERYSKNIEEHKGLDRYLYYKSSDILVFKMKIVVGVEKAIDYIPRLDLSNAEKSMSNLGLQIA